MNRILSATLFVLVLAGCNANNSGAAVTRSAQNTSAENTLLAEVPKGKWKGSFSNGLKGATISFDVVGNELKNLTFAGYWRCEGKLDLTTLGPEKGFVIKGSKVDGVIQEQGFQFELHGTFAGNKASGKLRFDFAAGDCSTYLLDWTATKQ